MKVISVFGSAAPVPGDADYEQAYQVGQLLAERGFAVATGGYAGTMEAVSKGAVEAGGRAIGVTTTQLDRIRSMPVNDYVSEHIVYHSLLQRMLHLVRNNDGMIVLPGGIGTLAEFALAWEFMRVDEIAMRPLVLLGALWHATMQTFIQPQFIEESHARAIQFAASADEAVRLATTAEPC